MADDSFAGVAKKVDGEMVQLDEEDQTLAALEEDLQAAQSRLDAAEIRFALALRRQAAELAKPLDEKATEKASVPADVKLEEMNGPDPKEPTLKGTADTKNAGAKSDKEVKREKYVAKRDREMRVRDATKKGRDKLRKAARDKRFQGLEEDESEPAKAAAPPAVAEAAKPKAGEPVFDSAVVRAGANSLTERLQSLKDRSNDAERRTALVRVLTGGKVNSYTSEPSDVLDDLESRELIDADFANLLFTLLKSDPSKGQGVPQEEWLEHAKKMSGVTRKDDEPFGEPEDMYLKWVDKHSLAEAEADLDEAQEKLQELIQLSEVWYGETEAEAAAAAAVVTVPAAGPKVDADYADKLQSQAEPKEESRGLKNTSALTSKVVSKEKWLTERRKEVQQRENGKKARGARRAEARDMKTSAGDV
jgi:hypothetical protein